MQITILAGGSRGDVQPYIALGKGLKDAGHSVRILSSDDFHDMVTDYGLDFFTTLGVGPKPFARRRLTVDNLAEAIERAVSDEAMRKKAASLGERIRAENGVAQAVTIIEQCRR